jgi:outer membrane usher protein FimD/PapC
LALNRSVWCPQFECSSGKYPGIAAHFCIRTGDSAVRQNQTSLTASTRIWKDADLVASVRQLTGAGQRDLQASIGVTLSLGRRTMASASAVHGTDGPGVALEAHRQLPQTTGAGFQVWTEAGQRSRVSASGDVTPAYGELSVASSGEPVVSPIGADGQFYFDSLPAGKHAATVTHAGATCAFTLVVPEIDGDLVELGMTRCTQPPTAGR